MKLDNTSLRSYNMSQIKGKDTSLEIKVRKYLYSNGFRYRKNVKTIQGTPDLYLKKYNTVIFVNGCFWHHHKNCKLAYIPKSNTDFWNNKFDKNVKNDKKNVRCLKKQGYNVIVIWECKLRKNFSGEMSRLISLIHKSKYK